MLFRVVILFLGFCFLPTTSSASIDPDTNIVKYDLNDPRNPDCPCHKAQQIAEDEYRNSQVHQRQNTVDRNEVNENNNASNSDKSSTSNSGNSNASNNGNTNSNNSDVNTNKTTFTSGSSGSQNHYSKFYKFQKKMKKWNKKVKRKLGKKNNGTKKGKRRVADCFHWV